MSIAGIAKEVATISVSALIFGDELTPLNITGVAVTVCGGSYMSLFWHLFARHPSSVSHNNISHASIGIGLFTHHNYRKRLESDIPLDSHGRPLDPDDSGGGSIALRDTYAVGHGNGGTSAVRLFPPPCLSWAY